MEASAWRYRPEFILTTLINGQPAGEHIEVMSPVATSDLLDRHAFISRSREGRLTAFALQLQGESGWDPVYPLSSPLAFTFWLKTKTATIPAAAASPDVSFGTPVYYVSNLSSSGEIDTGLSGNEVELFPGSGPLTGKTADLCTHLPSAEIPAGTYSLVRAGKIRAGQPVTFHLSEPLLPAQRRAALDLRLLPGGAWMVQLDGSGLLSRKVVVDETAMTEGVHTIVEIYRDTWRAPSPPIEYKINFNT